MWVGCCPGETKLINSWYTCQDQKGGGIDPVHLKQLILCKTSGQCTTDFTLTILADTVRWTFRISYMELYKFSLISKQPLRSEARNILPPCKLGVPDPVQTWTLHKFRTTSSPSQIHYETRTSGNTNNDTHNICDSFQALQKSNQRHKVQAPPPAVSRILQLTLMRLPCFSEMQNWQIDTSRTLGNKIHRLPLYNWIYRQKWFQ